MGGCQGYSSFYSEPTAFRSARNCGSVETLDRGRTSAQGSEMEAQAYLDPEPGVTL